MKRHSPVAPLPSPLATHTAALCSVIEPNTTKRYRTYVSHPWIVREIQSGARMVLSKRMVVVGLETEQEVAVLPPPRLEWTVRG